jgi:hypothetical protein
MKDEGEMQQVIVVDDFFADPHRIRELALRTSYVDVRPLNYPGFQSVRSFASEALKEAFTSLTGEDLIIEPKRLTFGKFRIMLSTTGSRLQVHLDSAADWTGLVYLNLPEQCRGGTGFYKHKETGLDRLPTIDEARRLGFNSSAEFDEKVIVPDTLKPGSWEQTMFVGMRFNRLVLFRGSELFHGHTVAWGDTIENGRLTQNFFFDSRDCPREGLVYRQAADT